MKAPKPESPLFSADPCSKATEAWHVLQSSPSRRVSRPLCFLLIVSTPFHPTRVAPLLLFLLWLPLNGPCSQLWCNGCLPVEQASSQEREGGNYWSICCVELLDVTQRSSVVTFPCTRVQGGMPLTRSYSLGVISPTCSIYWRREIIKYICIQVVNRRPTTVQTSKRNHILTGLNFPSVVIHSFLFYVLSMTAHTWQHNTSVLEIAQQSDLSALASCQLFHFGCVTPTCQKHNERTHVLLGLSASGGRVKRIVCRWLHQR